MVDREQLQREVNAEMARLECRYAGCAPMGGWRNKAVSNVADRHGENPYAVDRVLRGEQDPDDPYDIDGGVYPLSAVDARPR